MMNTQLKYVGSWQHGSTVLQKLDGPIGDGAVYYPNGDRFKGYFHLSYACINGPAHAAEGRYDFADGSYIEQAWIHTSKEMNPDFWGLHGVFRIHHPGGPDSIALFCHGNRRYEGDFREGVFVNKDVCTEKITLHVMSSENGRYKEYDMEAKLGKLGIQGFWSYEITSIKPDCITIEFYEEKYEVRPDKPLHLYKEIEGREWSDGCVYDSDDYTLDLTWIR